MRPKKKKRSLFAMAFRSVVAFVGAVLITGVLFLILPLTQAISKTVDDGLQLREVEVANVPPPPPPIEEEPEEEEEEEVEPPKLQEDVQPLDLQQLELALNPGFGDGLLGADFAIDLSSAIGGKKGGDALFSLSDLDQKPRAIHRVQPILSGKVRKKLKSGGGTVWVSFTVSVRGRVESPAILSSPDPVFDRPAMTAVKKWKFEPGKRNGKAVQFRMRLPMTFPKG